MKKNYEFYSIGEAANYKIAEDFVEAIKLMDKEIAIERLRGLLVWQDAKAEFKTIAGAFLALKDCKTCMDDV